MTTKAEHYEVLLRRLSQARAAGCNLEAAWLGYTVVEDRVNSALTQAGLAPGQKLGTKLSKLENLLKSERAYREAYFEPGLFASTRSWINRRNKLMHELASMLRPEPDLDAEFAAVAQQGEALARTFATAGRRLKKRRRK
jgi:hypothetical protein